jgi:hypothetical protein
MFDTFRLQSLNNALRTLELDPLSILRSDNRIPATVDSDEARTARPTWVGKNYKPGGILLLGKNPGGGSPSFRTLRPPWDFDFFDALRSFRAKRDLISYDHLSDVAQPASMRQWPLWRSIDAILHALEVDLFSVAIGNFVPFRTQGNSVSSDEFKAAWRLDTALTVETLRPKLIVKMTNEFRTFRRYCPADIKIQQFHRSNGDRYITESGKADLVHLRTFAQTLI